MAKRTEGALFDVSKRTTAATKLNEGDHVVCIAPAEEMESFVLQTEKNMFLRLDPNEIPEKKKSAVGVRGIRLSEKDAVTEVYPLAAGESREIALKDKKIVLNRLHIGKRDTKGTKK
jgi:DNA gyrase subunit A